ncbi:MAG: hypothetical protein JST87_05250 [Bacteroidetes bacterium]|nr:hypothetical protein [Bacteroidota bacterium]
MKQRSRYFGKRANTGSSVSNPPQNAEYPISYELYNSTSDLPLYKFIKCICNNDLSQLVISGKVPDHVLSETWVKIYGEYLEGMKDKMGAHKLRLVSHINDLQFTYDMIQLCVKRMKIAPSQPAIDFISTHIMVFGLKFNTEDMQGYMNDLKVVEGRSQTLLLHIAEKKQEYELLEGKSVDGDNVQITEKHFDSMIAQLSIYAKFHVDKRQFTVNEFCELYKSATEHAEAIEKINSKR